MATEIITKNGVTIALVTSEEKILTDIPSALDFIMSVQYETNSSRIAINKEAITEDFFVLSTCLAGEILQKFITYQVKFAVFGDFTKYTSKPLKDFMYESNHSNDIFFVSNKKEAIEKLLGAK